MSKRNVERVLLLKELKLVYKEVDDEDIVDYYQDKILNFNDDEVTYWFAFNIKSSDRKKLGKIIIDNKNIKYNYDFAANIPGADVKAHGKVIIDSKDLKYNYNFARRVEGADVKAHGKVIIDSKDPYYNAIFASIIPDADIKEHEKVLLASNDIENIGNYVLNIRDNKMENHSTKEALDIILNSNNDYIINYLYKEKEALLKKADKYSSYEKVLKKL